MSDVVLKKSVILDYLTILFELSSQFHCQKLFLTENKDLDEMPTIAQQTTAMGPAWEGADSFAPSTHSSNFQQMRWARWWSSESVCPAQGREGDFFPNLDLISLYI